MHTHTCTQTCTRTRIHVHVHSCILNPIFANLPLTMSHWLPAVDVIREWSQIWSSFAVSRFSLVYFRFSPSSSRQPPSLSLLSSIDCSWHSFHRQVERTIKNRYGCRRCGSRDKALMCGSCRDCCCWRMLGKLCMNCTRSTSESPRPFVCSSCQTLWLTAGKYFALATNNQHVFLASLSLSLPNLAAAIMSGVEQWHSLYNL